MMQGLARSVREIANDTIDTTMDGGQPDQESSESGKDNFTLYVVTRWYR